MRHVFAFMAILALSALTSCDDGLTPPVLEPGMAGSISVAPSANWPDADSVAGLWLIASLQYPLDSTKVITGVLIEPRTIFLYPSIGESLPYGMDSVDFRFPLAPGTYRYVGVIQQIRPELLVSNFRVVAMLEDPDHPGQPLPITVGPRQMVEGLRITIDFGSPPPQPFAVHP
jgi:hypothetical protein